MKQEIVNRVKGQHMEYFGILGGIGIPELMIILMIIVVLFGAKLLPKLSRSVGESATELRKSFGSSKRQAAPVAADNGTDTEVRTTTSMRAPRV